MFASGKQHLILHKTKSVTKSIDNTIKYHFHNKKLTRELYSKFNSKARQWSKHFVQQISNVDFFLQTLKLLFVHIHTIKSLNNP